jgi:putative tryptophan/tyrosine transport system substrate-binding protein
MRRREFITLLSGAAAWPLAARAQELDRIRRIGVLNALAEDDAEAQLRTMIFQRKLRELGWIEGRTIQIEYRWSGGNPERISSDAQELIAMKPDAVLAITTPAVLALRQATRSLPIVFTNVGDPVDSGFVESLARPGGNVTGIATFVNTMGGKWLELFKEIAPRVTRVTVILNPDNPTSRGVLRTIEAAAPSFGIRIGPAGVRSAGEIERAFGAIALEPDVGLLVVPDPITVANRALIIGLAAQHRIPAVYPFRYFVLSGGLISYGTVPEDQYRQAALYIDRILKGANPGELPVQQPTKFELVINLKTAKTMGLTIPESFLVRADEVIE